MLHSLRIGVSGMCLALGAGLAQAQYTVTEPQYFMWGDPSSTYDGSDPYVFRAIQVDTWYTGSPVGDPVAAAQLAASEILAYRSMLPGGPITIVLQRFGHDAYSTDYDAFGNPRSTPDDRDLRFFYPSDRIPAVDGLPAILDADFPIPPLSGDGNTARAFKHPFIQNATASNPRLKQWMNAFIAEYVAMQTNPSHTPYYGSSLPDPERFAFDTEAIIAAPPDKNPVYMLSELAKRPTYWANTDVPDILQALR